MASVHKGIFKDSDIEEISSKLKFIGKVGPGQKISVDGQYIQDNTYLTSLSRTISWYTSGECREKVYEFLTDVIQDAFSILESLGDSANESHIKICKNIIRDLINMKHGLTNLKETYKSDQKYVAKLQVLIQNLDVKTEELCKKKKLDYEQLTKDVETERAQARAEAEAAAAQAKKENSTPAKDSMTQSSEGDEAPEKKSTEKVKDAVSTEKTYAQAVQTDSVKKQPEPEKEPDQQETEQDDKPHSMSSRSSKGRRKKRGTSYQYESYYMSNPDDLYMYQTDLDAGIIKNKRN